MTKQDFFKRYGIKIERAPYLKKEIMKGEKINEKKYLKILEKKRELVDYVVPRLEDLISKHGKTDVKAYIIKKVGISYGGATSLFKSQFGKDYHISNNLIAINKILNETTDDDIVNLAKEISEKTRENKRRGALKARSANQKPDHEKEEIKKDVNEGRWEKSHVSEDILSSIDSYFRSWYDRGIEPCIRSIKYGRK